MCRKSKNEVKVLKDRTKGLNSRGNVAVNTQAEIKLGNGNAQKPGEQ